MKKSRSVIEAAHVSDKLYQSVRRVIQEGRRVVSRVANWAMVETYWRVGCLIVEDEQQGRRKAEYGKAVLADLAKRLTAEYGSGYDASNLRNMRAFYLAFPIRDALRHELSWTHYRSLMHIDDPIAREWYLNECIASSWGTRALDRQIETQAYERLLASANPDRRRKRRELELTPPANVLRRRRPGRPPKVQKIAPAHFSAEGSNMVLDVRGGGYGIIVAFSRRDGVGRVVGADLSPGLGAVCEYIAPFSWKVVLEGKYVQL